MTENEVISRYVFLTRLYVFATVNQFKPNDELDRIGRELGELIKNHHKSLIPNMAVADYAKSLVVGSEDVSEKIDKLTKAAIRYINKQAEKDLSDLADYNKKAESIMNEVNNILKDAGDGTE